ncbi:NADPH-dependent FMN reductase [Streptomyces sp. NPDC090108]|uniref:NADPH-dependent FMN reductase n=1 Tax=Streptomyces sp. NPDC090108 TaxID=3365947 RepID=UPI0038299051
MPRFGYGEPHRRAAPEGARTLTLPGGDRAGAPGGPAPSRREFALWPDLGRLPYFDADAEETALPPVVARLRAAVAASDGVLIATPEYAHGTSGVLKNALEWLVGGGELDGKPVALASASPAVSGGDRARAWPAQTLAVMMGARVIPRQLRLPGATRRIEHGRVVDGPGLAALGALLDDLAAAAAVARAENEALT